MNQRGSIDINRRIDDVFQLTNHHVPEWSIVVVREETLNETPNHVGKTFRSITVSNGHEMGFQGIVTRYEPPHASVVQLTGQYFDIEAGYTFEDLGGCTRVTQLSHVTGKGLFRLIFAVFGCLMKKSSSDAQRKELRSLKAFCEQYQEPTVA